METIPKWKSRRGSESVPPKRRAVGYGRGTNSNDRRLAKIIAQKSGFEWTHFVCEEFTTQRFIDRPEAKPLWFGLQDGELIIARNFYSIFVNQFDAVQTCRLLSARKIDLHVVGGFRLSKIKNHDKIIRETIKKEAARGKENKFIPPSTRAPSHTPVGWKRANGRLVPYTEQRLAACKILDMKDNQKLSFLNIAEENLRNPFWTWSKLNEPIIRKIHKAARERFPGPEGEILEAIEGTGL